MNAAPQAQLTAAPRSSPGPGIPDEAAGSLRSSGRLIGALFLAGFVTYGTGGLLTTSILDEGDVLGSVSAHHSGFVLGAVLMLTVVAVDIGKAVLFFPILGRSGRRPALSYLAGIIVEVTLMAVGVLSLLSLVPLGEQVESGTSSASLGQSLGTLAMDANDLAYQTGQAALAVGAFFLCLFLYRTRMVPRALAMWGVVGYVLHFSGATAELLGIHISMYLLIPGGLFELAFALWLIARGMTGRTDVADLADG